MAAKMKVKIKGTPKEVVKAAAQIAQAPATILRDTDFKRASKKKIEV